MKFIKLTLEYLRRNWLYVLILSLVPGILLAIFTNPTSVLNLLVKIANDPDKEMFITIISTVSEIRWWRILIFVPVLPICAVFVSALAGYESKHMRLGIININGFFRRVNNNIVNVIIIMLMFVILMQVFALLFSAITFLWVKVCSSVVACVVLSSITAVILMILCLFFVTIFVPLLPIMSITGLSVGKAMAESVKAVRGNIFKLFFAVCIPLIPIYLVLGLLGAYEVPYRKLVTCVMYTLMIMYYFTLMYCSYFSLLDIDREDLRNDIKYTD